MKGGLQWWFFSFVILVSGCHKPAPQWHVAAQARIALPEQHRDKDIHPTNGAGLRRALALQIRWLERQSAVEVDRQRHIHDHTFTYRELIPFYRQLLAFLKQGPSAAALSRWFGQHAQAYVYGPKGWSEAAPFLITSYYVPVLEASRTRTTTFRYPLYGKPTNLIVGRLSEFGLGAGHHQSEIVGRLDDGRLRPYFTRDEIEQQGKVNGSAPVVAWLNDPIDAFFLHVQGSGQLRFRNGAKAFVGYAQSNGHRYVSLGGLIHKDPRYRPSDGLSMQSIRNFFTEHPEAWQDYAAQLPRYIFFRPAQAPTSTLGLPVVDLATIAVDPAIIPFGLLVGMAIDEPQIDAAGKLSGWQPRALLALAQDTGSAIRKRHIDLFWGRGPEAAARAGRMKQWRPLTIFLPKAPATP